jgi:hypothetical protein
MNLLARLQAFAVFINLTTEENGVYFRAPTQKSRFFLGSFYKK